MSLDPKKVVASFDSASVLHAATVAALEHRPFPHLGNPAAVAALVRVAGHLPWPLLKQLYARIGGAEGIDPDQLGQVDLAAVARAFADAYTRSRYPAVVIGSSNGALAHLAAAMGTPWLPNTVLVPVHRVADPHRPDRALEFGRRVAGPLLRANPGVVLHQMHDSAQDELMVARMAYFRVKWLGLPEAYERFLDERLAAGAPVILVDDRSRWPVTRVGDRHVFQTGGRGGLTPQQNLETPFAPAADDDAPEAEWGAEPTFTQAVRDWCERHGHPCVVLTPDGPQEAAHPVATIVRDWTRQRGSAADRLILPSFVLGDPWRTITTGRVPFWTFFPVRSALESLEHHLAHTDGYRLADLLVFQHGADSPGSVTPRDLATVLRRHGVTPRLIAVDPRKSPHDIGSLAKYGPVLARERAAEVPFVPLDADEAIRGLRTVVGERGRPIAAP